MAKHAKLSPSSAARWMTCVGSVKLSEGFPDTSSIYADEGTAAHTLAEKCFVQDKDAKFFVGTVINVGELVFSVDEEMAAYVQVYLDYVRREGEGKPVLYEQSLPLTPLTGEEDAFGTADAVVVGTDTLHIIDLKFGMGQEVDAADNAQLMMYAAAARAEYALLGNFKKFKVSIVQPRRDHIDAEEFTDAELDVFEKEVRFTSQSIYAGNTELKWSVKGCLWCKAKGVCPEYKAKVEGAVALGFDNLDTVASVDLSHSMSLTDMVEDWSRAVRAEVERRLLSGVPVKDYKLVQGRMGARQWSDESAAIEKLKVQMRYPDEIIFSKKLTSPTQLEKKLAKEHPKHWGELQTLIVRKEGAPSVAPASDERPALDVSGGFSDLTTGE